MSAILVVDDSRSHRKNLVGILESLGCYIVEAENAEVAIKLAQEESFSLIFMDVVMPGISGYGALQIMKSMPELNDIPIIMLTETVSGFDKLKAKQSGASGILAKPFTKKAVLQSSKELRSIIFKKALDEKLPSKTVNFISKAKI